MSFSPTPDKRAYEMEWDNLEMVSGMLRPVQDPTSSGYNARHNLGVRAEILCGRVVDAVAYLNCYKVQFEGGCPPLPCVLAAQTSLLPVGARQLTTLVPGSTVWAIVHHQLTHGVIVAVEPLPNVDPTRGLSDFIHGASRCGLRIDRVHGAILGLDGNGGAIDWAAGRPFDGTAGGEWGAITETGLRVALDSFMVQLAVDEETGVFGFYHDQLLRVAGHNLQVLSAVHEEERLDDQSETVAYRGEATYPWEQLGVLDRDTDPFRDLTPQAAQVDEPHYASTEPVHDDQAPFHRRVELGGYLGQGGKTLILLPTEVEIHRYGGMGTTPPAVFESQVTLSGRYQVRAAKGLRLVKQPAIPGVRRLRRPEDPFGDNPTNYKASGIVGDGDDHEVTADVATSIDEHPHLQNVAALADSLAHTSNWEGMHPLHYHAKDWSVPEEGGTPAGTNQARVPFGDLAGGFYLPRPDAISIRVDHRYEEVDYYPNTSYVDLLDDGGVAIGDGYGAEIRMTGGHIFITAPGDVWLKSGRNVNAWAGHDAIVRAKHAAEISATEASVRIKAEHDLQLLAGNNKSIGAILIESKAPANYLYADRVGDDVEAGGIHLKTATGEIAAWARSIYLRTGGGDVEEGSITIDAARGRQDVITYATNATRYLVNVAADHFGTEGAIEVSNLYSRSVNVLGASTIIDGYVTIPSGGIVCKDWITVVDGHIATKQAPDYDNLVPTLTGKSLREAVKTLQESTDTEKDLVDIGRDNWRTIFIEDGGWYDEDRPGNDQTIEAVGFSFRKDRHYRTEEFILYEDRWQQAARLGGGAPATWTEMPVQAGSEVTYPYPGAAKWKDQACLYEQDLVLYDHGSGLAKPRDPETYGAPAFAEPNARRLDGHYAVIV